jgi:hypothetical protein
MTTDNQSVSTSNSKNSKDELTFSKAVSMGRTIAIKHTDKTSTTTLKTLSLRPTKSVKKNSSFRPIRKIK